MNVRELRARRHDVFLAAEKIVNAAIASGHDLKGADLDQYNKHLGEIKEVDSLLARAEGLHDVDPNSAGNPRWQAGPNLGVAIAGNATNGNGHGPAIGRDADGREIPIFSKGQSIAAYMKEKRGVPAADGVTTDALVRGMAGVGRVSSEIRAALNEGADTAGGVTVPTILTGGIIDLLRARSVMFAAGARTALLDTGKATTMVAIASDPVAAWRNENADVAISDMTFAPISMTPKSLAVLLVLSDELMEDGVGLSDAIQMSLAGAFAAELDRVGLIGSGVSPEPKGVSKVSGIGSYSMGTNGAALANYDPFIEALAILQTANAADPTACIIAPRTNKSMNLLKCATTNEPLPKPPAIANLPFLVTSKLPINETQGSSNAASRAVMGHYPDVVIGVRHELRIQLLRERYAEKLQLAIRADLRADVAVLHPANFVNVVGIL
jgi:HK97 family phage major capsid protein